MLCHLQTGIHRGVKSRDGARANRFNCSPTLSTSPRSCADRVGQVGASQDGAPGNEVSEGTYEHEPSAAALCTRTDVDGSVRVGHDRMGCIGAQLTPSCRRIRLMSHVRF